jgi:hypothetical protein
VENKEEAEKRARWKIEEAERDRIEAEAMRAERERLAAGHAEETRLAKERYVQVQAEAAEAERVRLEALKPDVERIQGFGAAIRSFAGHPPVVGEKKARAFLARAVADLRKIAARCETVTVVEADKTV